jgi:hypothetical protein
LRSRCTCLPGCGRRPSTSWAGVYGSYGLSGAGPEAAAAERYLRSAVRIKEEWIFEIPESIYEHLKEEALERVSRDPSDWQVVALALLSRSEILSEDEDFFGCGVATWAVQTCEACGASGDGA